MTTRLILIRHGSTSWNLKGRYCGARDIGLSAQGRREARDTHGAFKKVKVERIYTSDRKRAVETCKIIFKGRPAQRLPDLREIHFGIFEGLTYSEVLRKYPRVYARWLRDPFGVTIPKGEKMAAFRKRVVKAFGSILSLNRNKSVAVVCHGGTISIFLNSLFKTKEFWKHIPRPASSTILSFKNGRPKMERFSKIYG